MIFTNKGQQLWKQLTQTDLVEFQKTYSPRCRGEKLRRRKEIVKCFGKPIEKLSLDEFKDYSKPNFHAQFYLKELWSHLTKKEQEAVKQMSEWAFIFPVTFENDKDFLQACAGRLNKFFKRKFTVSRTIKHEGQKNQSK